MLGNNWDNGAGQAVTRPGQPDCVTPGALFAASVTYSEYLQPQNVL